MDNPNDLGPNRGRCMTWPLPRPDFKEDATKSEEQEQVQREQEGSSRKSSSRRNAWGNFSYADLITKAIQSSSEQRLTLSQIYEWMVNNVPYFKDKGESNSSAGWKNSIRHNLSLHSRFVRVQNEGTGKSSWWTLNSDTKPGKATRRRAGSIDGVVRAERRRGRMKKSLKPISDSTDEGSEIGTPGLASPGVKAQQQIWARRDSDYMRGDRTPDSNECESPVRSRTTSNASSCGRPSPIIPGGDLDSMATMSPMFSDYMHGEYLPRNNSTGNNNELVDTFDSMIIQSPYSADGSFQPMLENGMPTGGASLHSRHGSQYSVSSNQQLSGLRSPRDMHSIPSGGYNSNQQQFNLPQKTMMLQSRQSAANQHQSHVYDHLQHHQPHQFPHHEPYQHQGTPSQPSHISMAHDSNELFSMLPSMNNNVRDDFGSDGTSIMQDYSNMGQNNYSYNNPANQQADLFSTQSYQTQPHDINDMDQMPMISNRHRQQNLNQVNMANLHQPMMHSQNVGQHQVQHRQHQQHQGINQFNALNEKLPNDEEEFDIFHPNIEYDSMPSELMHDNSVLLDNANNPLLPVSSMQSVSNRPVTTTQQ